MPITSIKLDNNKYEIQHNFDDPNKTEVIFKALRYGEEWRNLVGDNLIYWLVMEIDELKKKLVNQEVASGRY